MTLVSNPPLPPAPRASRPESPGRSTTFDLIEGSGGLTVVFQPLFEIERSRGDQQLHSLECLARGPKGTHLESPASLFSFARGQGDESDIRHACLARALEQASALEGPPRIGVNVPTVDLSDPAFLASLQELCEKSRFPLGRLIVEIGGFDQGDGARLRSAVQGLHALGARVAFDDAGLGTFRVDLLRDVRPDFLKLDRPLVARAAVDTTQRPLLVAQVDLARKLGIRPMAKGIESKEEFETAMAAGVEIVQGFHLARPMTVAEMKRSGLLDLDSTWKKRPR